MRTNSEGEKLLTVAERGPGQVDEVRFFEEATAPHLLERFAKLRGTSYGGVTWVMDSGAEMSCLSQRAFGKFVESGHNLKLTQEGPKLRTANSGTM